MLEKERRIYLQEFHIELQFQRIKNSILFRNHPEQVEPLENWIELFRIRYKSEEKAEIL